MRRQPLFDGCLAECRLLHHGLIFNPHLLTGRRNRANPLRHRGNRHPDDRHDHEGEDGRVSRNGYNIMHLVRSLTSERNRLHTEPTRLGSCTQSRASVSVLRCTQSAKHTKVKCIARCAQSGDAQAAARRAAQFMPATLRASIQRIRTNTIRLQLT